MAGLLHDPTFWVAVAFVVFVICVFKPIRAALLDELDKKITQIRHDVEQAEKLREEAQSLLANYQRQQRQTQQDSEGIITRAREESERHQIEAASALKEMVHRQEALAREKITQAEEAAVRQIRAKSIDLAMAATEKILAERLAGENGNHLIDVAINEISNKMQ